MARYTVIADIGKAIVDMLKDKIVPEPLSKPESIGICDPKDRGSFVVGIHPYNLSENGDVRRVEPIVLPDGNLQNPPTSYQLSFMVSIASKAEIANRALDEQRIMGKIIQTFNDYPVLPPEYLPEPFRIVGEDISIRMLPLELEEKVKIWSMYSEPYKLSVFYSAGPILIDSAIVRKPSKRVTSVEFGKNHR